MNTNNQPEVIVLPSKRGAQAVREFNAGRQAPGAAGSA
jgi:hypothetical protein